MLISPVHYSDCYNCHETTHSSRIYLSCTLYDTLVHLLQGDLCAYKRPCSCSMSPAWIKHPVTSWSTHWYTLHCTYSNVRFLVRDQIHCLECLSVLELVALCFLVIFPFDLCSSYVLNYCFLCKCIVSLCGSSHFRDGGEMVWSMFLMVGRYILECFPESILVAWLAKISSHCWLFSSFMCSSDISP